MRVYKEGEDYIKRHSWNQEGNQKVMDKQLLKQRIQNELLFRMREFAPSEPFTLLQNLEMWAKVFTQLLAEGISDQELQDQMLDAAPFFSNMPPAPHELVCLVGIKSHDNPGGNKFFTTNERHSITRLADGSMAYKVIGYADTVEEAQIILYGRADTTEKRAWMP